eukprot:107527-Rhodomonas_salina.3
MVLYAMRYCLLYGPMRHAVLPSSAGYQPTLSAYISPTLSADAPAMLLQIHYAACGNDLGYAATRYWQGAAGSRRKETSTFVNCTRQEALPLSDVAMSHTRYQPPPVLALLLRLSYAMSGTDVAYDAMLCAVLT